MNLQQIVAALCKRQAQTLHKPEQEAPATWRGRLARLVRRRLGVGGSLFLLATLTLPTLAQLDKNNTGMSDVWERHYNRDNPGQLFDPENTAHHPDADPDGDGWTNLQESIAGTDPFSGNPPEGMVATLVTHLKDQVEAPSPEYPEGRIINLAIISWDTLPGKQYILKASPDLSTESWITVDLPYFGDGQPAAVSITLTDTEGEAPKRLFWRVLVEDPQTDSDGDGLTDYEEYLLGSNPYVADTSGDGVPDGWLVVHGYNPNNDHENIMFGDSDVTVPDAYNLGVQDHPDATLEDLDGDGVPNIHDADPNDHEIDWEKTPETRYVWIEQVEKIGAKAVSRHGHILFPGDNDGISTIAQSEILWDSATSSWVDMPAKNSWYDSGLVDVVDGETEPFDHEWFRIGGMNDGGAVVGVSNSFSIGQTLGGQIPFHAIMKWEMAGTATDLYAAPTYLMPSTEPASANEQISEILPYPIIPHIADDGTIISLTWEYVHDEYIWVSKNVHQGDHSNMMIEWAAFDWSRDGDLAAILDNQTGLFVEREPNLPKSVIHLRDGGAIESLQGLLANSGDEILDTDIARTPATTASQDGRFWFTVNQSNGNAVFLEKRDGGSGVSRWHSPPSMSEGAIGLNALGEAITSTKIWRNAEYTDLNELTEKPESVTITEALDLASNGIILVEANDDGVMKTGLLMPIEITVVFGEGPGNGANELEHTTAKENLENFLETVKVSKKENIWTVKGKDDRLYTIEIGTDEATLVRALSTTGQTVIFDGHANFGLGPNFSKATHKTIDSFTNFGTGATDIPIAFRGDGSETDVMPYINGQTPWPSGEELIALFPIKQKIDEEGWAFLVLDATEIKGAVTNLPVADMPGRWKFESGHGVSAGSPLEKQGVGLEEYHFMTASQSKRVIVSAPGNDVPPLRYKTFFYNACSSGPHFIENFKHGEFIYTNRTCAVFNATRWYVKGLIEEKTTDEILHILNTENADGDDNNQNITYEVKSF